NPLELADLGRGKCPAEIRMIELRNAAAFGYRVDICLQSRNGVVEARGLDCPSQAQAVHVIGDILDAVGYFLAANDEEDPRLSKEIVKRFDRRDVFMIGDDDEVITVRPIP